MFPKVKEWINNKENPGKHLFYWTMIIWTLLNCVLLPYEGFELNRGTSTNALFATAASKPPHISAGRFLVWEKPYMVEPYGRAPIKITEVSFFSLITEYLGGVIVLLFVSAIIQ